MAEVFSELSARIERPSYFSSLLAAIVVGFLPIPVFVICIGSLAVDLEMNRPGLFAIILNVRWWYAAGFVATILILPVVRWRQPMRRAYWLLATCCFAVNPIILEIMVWILPERPWLGHLNVAAFTGTPIVLAGLVGLLFVPIQRLVERFFELFRWRRRVR